MVPVWYRGVHRFETSLRYTPLMARPKVHDETLRVKLLDEAGRLLSDEGPAALNLRRLATEAGTSTTAVYSLFGGKPGLVRALFLEAFGRFGARLGQVPKTDNPIADLRALGVAYRESALADPHLYAVMFGRAIAEFEPDPDDAATSLATMDPLVDAVRAASDAGLLVDVEPGEVAIALWGVVHGLVSLELRGSMPDGFDVAGNYAHMLTMTLRGWLRDPTQLP